MRELLRRFAQSTMPENAGQAWIFAGAFLIAFSLLAFEVSTVRTVNFAVGPSFIYFAIALALPAYAQWRGSRVSGASRTLESSAFS